MRVLITLLVFFLWACEGKVAGTASETETSISGVALNSDGSPLSHFQLRVAPEVSEGTLNKGTNFIDTLIQNEEGKFNFVLRAKGVYLLQALSDSAGFVQRIEIDSANEELELPTDTIAEWRTVHGEVLNTMSEQIPSTITVLGSGQKVETNTSGEFDLTHLDLFHYEVLIEPNDSKYQKKKVSISPLSDSLRLFVVEVSDAPPLIMDNFEDNDTLGSFHSVNGGSEWWVGQSGGEVSMDFIANPLHCNVCEVPLNRVLKATIDVDEGLEYPYALFGINTLKGTNFGVDSVYADFSDLKSFSFMARGSGILRVQFLTEKSLSDFNNESHFMFEVNLSSGWQQFKVLPQDIPDLTHESETVKWADYDHQVWGLSFVSITDGEVFLDELSIEGLDISEFTVN